MNGTQRQLRVGLIGAGGIASVHVEGWLAAGATISVYSIAGAEELARKYPIIVRATLEELFAAADVVDVVSPTTTHCGLAVQALEHGKPVIVEKPLGATVDDAAMIVAAAERAGLPVFPAHVVRYFPEYARVYDEVASGRLGKLAVLRFERAGQAPRSGSWFFSEDDGGGIVLDQMIHDIDQARWLAGDVRQVSAVQNPPSAAGRTPERVAAQVVLTHVGGAVSYVQGTWGPKGLEFHTSLSVAGSAGYVEYDSRSGTVVRNLPEQEDREGYLPPRTSAESPYTAELRDFAAAIDDPARARVGLIDGVHAVAIAEACQRSLRTGQPVDVDLDALRDRFGPALSNRAAVPECATATTPNAGAIA